MVDLVIGPEPPEADTAGLAVAFLVETPIAMIVGKSPRWVGEIRFEALVGADWLMIGTVRANRRIRALDLAEPLQPAGIALVTSSERPPTPALPNFSDCVLQVDRSEFGQGIPKGYIHQHFGSPVDSLTAVHLGQSGARRKGVQ